jgi:NADH-quinone oxidoreductase subunit N
MKKSRQRINIMLPLTIDYNLFGSELFLALTSMLLLVMAAMRTDRGEGALPMVSGFAVLALLVAVGEIATNTTLWTRSLAFHDMWVSDTFSAVLKITCLVGAAAAVAFALKPLQLENTARFEYPVLVMLSTIGMMTMVSANDFMVLYVGLELSALPLYVLAAIRRDALNAAEAGMKYFILGALSSGMLLFGISLVYGFIGSTQFDTIGHALGAMPADTKAGAVVGMAFILAGVAFKISAVPFHMWVPDVYQGAPGAVTALFAMVPKIAALGMLIRLLFVPFAPLMNDWVQIIAFLSLASMMWGAFAAIAQNNIKRLLAYSSIANLGYAILALVTGTVPGIAAALFYMMIYLAMTAGTFAVVLSLRRDGEMVEERGLCRSVPTSPRTGLRPRAYDVCDVGPATAGGLYGQADGVPGGDGGWVYHTGGDWGGDLGGGGLLLSARGAGDVF